MINNSINRQYAFDACNILHQCILDWLDAAEQAYKTKNWTVSTPKSCGQFAQ